MVLLSDFVLLIYGYENVEFAQDEDEQESKEELVP